MINDHGCVNQWLVRGFRREQSSLVGGYFFISQNPVAPGATLIAQLAAPFFGASPALVQQFAMRTSRTEGPPSILFLETGLVFC